MLIIDEFFRENKNFVLTEVLAETYLLSFFNEKQKKMKLLFLENGWKFLESETTQSPISGPCASF